MTTSASNGLVLLTVSCVLTVGGAVFNTGLPCADDCSYLEDGKYHKCGLPDCGDYIECSGQATTEVRCNTQTEFDHYAQRCVTEVMGSSTCVPAIVGSPEPPPTEDYISTMYALSDGVSGCGGNPAAASTVDARSQLECAMKCGQLHPNDCGHFAMDQGACLMYAYNQVPCSTAIFDRQS